jgi:hypothetical protein
MLDPKNAKMNFRGLLSRDLQSGTGNAAVSTSLWKSNGSALAPWHGTAGSWAEGRCWVGKTSLRR